MRARVRGVCTGNPVHPTQVDAEIAIFYPKIRDKLVEHGVLKAEKEATKKATKEKLDKVRCVDAPVFLGFDLHANQSLLCSLTQRGHARLLRGQTL